MTFTLPKNDGDNTLHGGPQGFDKRVWKATPVSTAEGQGLELTYVSKDGEEGFPGNLSAKVVYTLTERNELKIDYTATTDKDTVVNLTNHSYFNLAGQGEGDILGHQVMIDASRFTPVDAGLIPLGELRAVKGTPFDFTTVTAIGARIGQSDQQLKLGNGHRAGPAVLHRQLSGRVGARQRRKNVSVPQRVLHGDAALPGFAQQGQLPDYGAEAGEHLPHHDGLPLLGAIRGTGRIAR